MVSVSQNGVFNLVSIVHHPNDPHGEPLNSNRKEGRAEAEFISISSRLQTILAHDEKINKSGVWEGEMGKASPVPWLLCAKC